MNDETPSDRTDRRKVDPWREEIRESIKALAAAVDALTEKLEKHMQRTAPVTDAYGKLQAGYKFMQWLRSVFEWMLKQWQPIFITCIAVKVIWHGGNWTEAWTSMMKIFKAD
jgi:hypothetical protein